MDSNTIKAEELNQEDLKKRKSSTIQRAQHQSHFFSCERKAMQNKKLSLQAKGLLGLLLSFSDNFIIHKDALAQFSKNGREATRTAFNELLEAKYVYMHVYLLKGLKRVKYYLFETPYDENSEEFKEFLRGAEKPRAVKKPADKTTLNNTNIDNTNIDNTNLGKPPKKVRYSENVGMTKRDYNKLIEKFGKEKVMLAVEKYDRWKYNKGAKNCDDFQGVSNWIEGDELQEERQKEAMAKIKSKNIEFLNSHMEYLERVSAKGNLRYNKEEVHDSVLGFSTSVSGPKMIENVKKWDQFRKIIK